MTAGFFNPIRGEFTGQNNNGVPIRMVLINIFGTPEDERGTLNAFLNPINFYEFAGSDSDADDRNLRATFSFNYFRLGEARFEQPSCLVQRRIVLVNGSTQELLFSFTPTFSYASSLTVNEQVNVQAQTIIDAINSVELTPEIPDDLSIEISDLQLGEESLTLQFESAEGLTGFSILASADLTDDFSMNLTDNSVITETSPGSYQAVIDNSDLPDSLFICIQL